MMDWKRLAPDFAYDGSWRDIYVLDTTIAEWQKVWDALRQPKAVTVFSVASVVQPMPEDVTAAFNRSQGLPYLSVLVGKVLLNCHFFHSGEIEFDLDPREVTSAIEADSLGNFMRMIGDLTQKTVILTRENIQHEVIAKYLPSTGYTIWTAQFR